MDYFKLLSALSLPLGILILLLLVCRSLVLWYFKIPDMVQRQDQLINEIQKQNSLMKKILGEPVEEPKEEKEMETLSFTEMRYGKH